MLPPLPDPPAVAVILLPLRSRSSCDRKKISPPSPDAVAAVMLPTLSKLIELVSILSIPALPDPSLRTLTKPPLFIFKRAVFISTFPEFPVGTGGSLSNCSKLSLTVLAEETIQLGF